MYVQYVDLKITSKNFTRTLEISQGWVIVPKVDIFTESHVMLLFMDAAYLTGELEEYEAKIHLRIQGLLSLKAISLNGRQCPLRTWFSVAL